MTRLSNARRRVPSAAFALAAFALAAFVLVALVGLGVLIWDVASIVLPVHHVTTVAPLDAVLAAVATYVWVPAVGLFLGAVAAAPPLAARTRRSTAWTVAVGAAGLGLLAVGLLGVALSLNRLLGALHFSPATPTGALLVGLAVAPRRPRQADRSRNEA